MSDGHFGRPSIQLLIASIAALLAHILVPYGVVRFGGPAAPSPDWLSRGEVVAQAQDHAGRTLLNASPSLALAGILLAVAAAGLMVFLGFQPLSVTAARWVGAGAAAIASLGLALAGMASMYSIGTGFASFLGSLSRAEFVASFWSVSPVVVTALAGYGLWQARSVALRVVAARDGLRDEATRAQNIGMEGLVFMAAVLLVPWSISLIPDGVSDALGAELPYDDPAPLWLSAEDIQSVTPAEAHPEGRARFPAGWGALDVALHLMLAFAWSAFTAGWLRNLAATASSAGAPLRITVGARMTLVPVALLLAAAVIGYVLAWILVAPGDESATFLPGFFPILALLPLIWMARHVLHGLGKLRPAPIPVDP